MPEPARDDSAYTAGLVRGFDRPRYYAALFAPARARAHLLALYALAAEVARVPDAVREPALGEIRLQYWRDAVERIGEGHGGETPVLAALAEAVRAFSLPVAPLLDLIDARRADLYADPQPDRRALEGFLGETESVVFQLAALVLRPGSSEATAEAAGHAGIAYGLAHRLANLSRARSRGRAVLPADILAAHGIERQAVFAGEGSPGLREAVQDACDFIVEHVAKAEAALRAAPEAARPAFLPLAVVRPLVKRIRAAGPRLAHEPITLSDLAMLASITTGALSRSLQRGRSPRQTR